MVLSRLVNRLLSSAASASGLPLTEVHDVRGFRVELTNSRPDIDSKAVLERLGEALDLIATYQPTRMAHLRRDVRQICVERAAHRGEYRPAAREVMTELTFLARRDISAAVVASSVLHEGVHARTFKGAPNLAGYQPAREERICRKAELYFGLALPDALKGPVIERALASLALSDEDVAPRSTDAERRAAIARVDREAIERMRGE